MGTRRFASSSFAESAKTEASRYGNNHVYSHTRGWDLGVLVHARIDENGDDIFEVWTTGGSNDSGTKRLIAEVSPSGVVASA